MDLGPLGTPAHCRLTGGGILSHVGGVLEICISSLDHGLQGEGDRDALTPLEPLHETKRNEIPWYV